MPPLQTRLPIPFARATRIAERMMLSAITVTVTVAPLTISTGGREPDLGCELQHVAPDIAADERGDARGGDADEHDRLVVVHQPGAGDLAVDAQADEDLNRLARSSRWS